MAGRLKLGQILVNRGLLEPDQLAAALAAQQASGAWLGMTLVRLGFVDEETLIRTLAGQLKLPVARIRGKRVSPEVLECVGADVAEKHRCLPLFFKQERGQRVLFVAMEDPSDAEALEEISAASGETLRAVLVAPTELEEALQRHYHGAADTGEAPDGLAAREPLHARSRLEAAPEPEARADDEWSPRTDPDDLGLDLDGAYDGADLADETVDDPDPLAAALLPEPPRPAPGEARVAALDPAFILRALSQLLVEKGVIGRDELVQRVGELAARAAGRG